MTKVYTLVETVKDRRDTNRNVGYVCKAPNGWVETFTSAQIKRLMREGCKFTSLKLDASGRLIVDIKNAQPPKPALEPQRPHPLPRRSFKTFSGDGLRAVTREFTLNKKPRYAVSAILSALNEHTPGKVCVVRGIRRTGKTTAIFHTIDSLLNQGVAADSIAYIAATQDTDVHELIGLLENCVWKYVFVDEVTLVHGIIDHLKTLSDIVAVGRKVILSGTDSYVWPIAAMDVLYGRSIDVEMTTMSFREFADICGERLKGLSKSEAVTYFGRYGGVLDPKEYAGLKNAYVSLQSALVSNIADTITRNKDHKSVMEHAGSLYGIARNRLVEAVICGILSAAQTQSRDFFTMVGVSFPEIVREILDAGNIKAVGVGKDVLRSLISALTQLNVLGRVANVAATTDNVKPSKYGVEFVCHVSSLYNTLVDFKEFEGNDIGKLTGAALENLVLSQCVQFAERTRVGVGFCRYDDLSSNTVGAKTNQTPEVDVVFTRSRLDEAVGVYKPYYRFLSK